MSIHASTNQLESVLAFLREMVRKRLSAYFTEEAASFHLPDHVSFDHQSGYLSDFITSHDLNIEEFTILLIALAPHVQPDFFDEIIKKEIPHAGDFPKFGGTRGKQFRGFIPTGQTALFILAGDETSKQIEIRSLFSEEHLFAQKKILWLDEVPPGEPRMSANIILSQEYVEVFTTGKVARPRFGMRFPAQYIETKMDWEDLVLSKDTLDQVRELETWVKYGELLLSEYGMSKRVKPGYRALFHGPPGTGKTLTATLIGKHTSREVYRIDLSMVVSKYIGETEKNLSNLFAKADNKDWILFFDEADALFGKRTNVKDAHDKYANQEVAYLLQRIEEYNGLVILASNFKSNIDEAFLRRFQAIIHFPMPKARERLKLWRKALPEKFQFDSNVNIEKIAQKYELSGSGITNVIHYTCLSALEKNTSKLSSDMLLAGIKREFFKEGRVIT